MTLDNNKYFKGLFLIFGVVLSILSIISFKIAFIALVGLTGLIFTFYHLEISLGLFLLVMTIAPHALWNNSFFVLASVFYFGVYVIQIIAGKREYFSIKEIKISLLLFLFFSIYSVVIAYDVKDSLRIFLLLASSILFSIVFMQMMKDKKTINMFLDLICISIVLTGAYGILQKFIGIEIRADFIDTIVSSGMPGRLFSTMGDNPNNYAEYLTLFIPLCIAHFLNTKNEMKKLIILGVIAIGLYNLLYTLSRGAYVTFAFGALIFMLMVKPKLVPMALIAGIALIPLLPSFLINRLLTIGKDSSSKYRLLIWTGALDTLKHNWVSGIGMGPNSFKHVFAQFADPVARPAMHSHNVFLQVFLDSGIGGFLSYVSFMFVFFKDSFTHFINTTDSYFKNLIAAFVFAIAATTAYGMAEYIWFYPRVMLCFWIVIGMCMGTVKLSKGGAK